MLLELPLLLEPVKLLEPVAVVELCCCWSSVVVGLELPLLAYIVVAVGVSLSRCSCCCCAVVDSVVVVDLSRRCSWFVLKYSQL